MNKGSLTHERDNFVLDGKYLGTITKDFVLVADILRESAYQIKVRGFSDYPIFLISKTDIPIGNLLIHKKDMALEWNYYASFLDEFVQRGIIDSDKKDAFKLSYKNLNEFCCVFVIEHEFINFVYIPYPID